MCMSLSMDLSVSVNAPVFVCLRCLHAEAFLLGLEIQGPQLVLGMGGLDKAALPFATS